jgi:PAS domain S-box-containing protein
LNNASPIPVKYAEIALLSFCLLGLYLSSRISYLLFHSLGEIFSIVVACGVFMIALNADRFMKNSYFQVIGTAYLFVAGIDLTHTLAYKGMGVSQGYDSNLPTQLWIAARYIESISLLIAPSFADRKLKMSWVALGYFTGISLLLGSIFYWNIFPVCFVDGVGLTPFKIVSEYVISGILLSSIGVLLRKRQTFDERILRLLIGSVLITIGSELAFTFYVDAYDLSNLTGHFLKIISFYLIYKAVIETGIVKPFDLTFRNLKESENALRMSEERFRTIFQTSPDSISINRERDGLYVDINEGFTNFTGYTREEAIGRSTMDLDIWHDPAEGRRMVSILREEGLVMNMEITFRLKGGTLLPALISARNILLDGVPHVLTVTKGIKEIRAASDALEEQVQIRTLALTETNAALGLEMSEREGAERALRKSEKELRILSSQLMIAEENERQRIARELHDSIGQTLSAIKFSMENTIKGLKDTPTHRDIETLEAMIPITQGAIEEVRRIVMALRPSILDDLGVLATIEWACREFEATYKTISIEKEIAVTETDVPEPLKMVVFRVLQEALNNVAKHSQADKVTIRIVKIQGRTELSIGDNGRGMDTNDALTLKGTRGGFGLVSMRERAELAGASFDLSSSAGMGTTIRISWTES